MNRGFPRAPRGRRSAGAAAGIVLLLGAAGAAAQNRPPAVAYLYPAGARQGETLRAIVGGQRLPENATPFFSGAGVRATVIARHRPLKPEEQEERQKELRELVQRKREAGRTPAGRPRAGAARWSEEDEQRLAQLTEEMAMLGRSRNAPAFGERIEIEITVAPEAAPGRREFRLGGAGGVSAPVIFLVGNLPEISEPPLTASEVMAIVGEPRAGPLGRRAASERPALQLAPPIVVNGQIGPGECDRYRFSAAAGRRIVIAVAARELRPYIADAVPGWCDPVVTVRDADGRELACSDHFRFHPDPVLCFVPPADGDYTLEIRDCIYRGREDFVYRMTVGEIPYVTDLSPLGGRAGTPTRVVWRGWNLPRTAFDFPGNLPPGIHPLPELPNGALASPFLRWAVDTLPEVEELRRRGGPQRQSVTLPVTVNGAIEKPGERDVYAFGGRAGQMVVLEALARRLGSPLDASLTLADASGVVLAFNDDTEDRGAGLVTHHADARIAFTLPKDGLYEASIADLQGKAGPEYRYRLRLSEARPDFELRVVPSGVVIRRGASATVTVHALRRDGFDGDIEVQLKNARGFTLAGGRIPAGQEQVRMTLNATRGQEPGPVDLVFEGAADIASARVVRAALPAEDQMQAFLWRFLTPVSTFTALVLPGGTGGPARPGIAAPSASVQNIRLSAGGKASFTVETPPQARRAGRVTLALNEPPPDVTLERAAESGGRIEVVLAAAADAKVGARGNLIFDIILERTESAPPAATPPAAPAPAASSSRSDGARRVVLGQLPAIPYEITRP